MSESAASPRSAESLHLFRVHRNGRNTRGQRVLAATCLCGWQHMTACPVFRRRSRTAYLRRRWEDHCDA